MSICKRILVGAVLLAGVLIFGGTVYGATEKMENSCVQCHSGLPGGSFLGVKSHSWKGSVHAKHDVTCDQCHGGNPNAVTKNEAHVGSLGSRNPQSKIYFKNIPATCGKCHGAEFYKFRQSLHYKLLESKGKGPECVTCHGSMVTSILTPDNVATVCERCHNRRMNIRPYIPQKAKAVLLLLRESKSLLDLHEKVYQPGAESEQNHNLQEARAFLHSAKLEWHRFDLDRITEYLQEMYNSLEPDREP